MTTIREPGPSVDTGVIRALAPGVGVLPNDYRSFLLATNGGVPEEQQIPEPSDIGIQVRGFFSVGDSTSGDLSMTRALATWADRYPDGYVPIALCEGSNLLLMATGEESTGRVVYWDHDREADEGEPARTDNLTPVADSFTALLAALTDDATDDAVVQRLLENSTGWVDPDFKPEFS
jgi:hypothetical protein